MARSDPRYSVYPAPKAVEVVGDTAPALNRAIECWAALLTRAMARNAKRFWNAGPNSVTGKMEDMYAIKEWCVLADSLKGRRCDPAFAAPGDLLAAAVDDANTLENKVLRWFSMELPPEQYSEIELTDKCVAKLAKKLRDLDYPDAWALILAVQWFWDHQSEGIDIENDEWWTLRFRHEWRGKQQESKDGDPSKGGRRGNRRGAKRPPADR
jgi:hypothetical protein